MIRYVFELRGPKMRSGKHQQYDLHTTRNTRTFFLEALLADDGVEHAPELGRVEAPFAPAPVY